jgi:hypothetical protein
MIYCGVSCLSLIVRDLRQQYNMRSIETSALRTITRSLAALNHHEITNWNRALSECYCICTNSYGQGAWKIVQSVLFQEFEAAKTLWDTSISSNVSNIGMYSLLLHQINYHSWLLILK